MRRTLIALTVFLALLPVDLRAADLLVDHVEYIRAFGTAQQMSLFFPGCDTQGIYTLTLKNGQDEAHRATSGSVSVNGVELVGTADFAQSPAPVVITRIIGNVAERNTIALSASAPQGSVIGWQVTAEVNCPDITIESPIVGEVFNRKEITFTGKVRHRTPEVGVIVNGVLAQVNGNDWAANGVELAAGQNVVKARAIFEDGTSAETAAQVTNQDPNAASIALNTEVDSGIAPLTVNFTFENRTRKKLVAYRVDYEGDGTFDPEVPSLENFEHVYTQVGLYPATVVARDEQGAEYAASFSVNVHPLPPLKSKWEKMKAHLIAGEVTTALQDFAPDEAEIQQQVFTTLSSRLPQVVSEMRDIQLVYLKGRAAKYRLRREEPPNGEVTYYVSFQLDPSGFWEIEGF